MIKTFSYINYSKESIKQEINKTRNQEIKKSRNQET